MIQKSSFVLSIVALAGACTCQAPRQDRAPAAERPAPVACAETPAVAAVAKPLEELQADRQPTALELEYPPVTWWGEIVLKGEPGPFAEAPLDEAAEAHRAWIDTLARGARASQGRAAERSAPAAEPVLVSDTETTPAPAGCHMRRVDDSRRSILIYQAPGVTPIAQVDQGAPCEILESRIHAGTRWYRVAVRGVDGWSPLVDAF